MLNFIWLGLIVAAVLLGGSTGKLKEVADGAIKGAETAVTLSLGLIGVMTVWLGVMRLAERSGFIHLLAKAVRPVLVRLFPEVPAEHPAMGSIVMNIAANMLGLVNAATPLGLRAMKDLERLNPHPGTATNAMCTFLAINTGSVQLIPITAIALLASAGSKSPYAIVGTSLLATCFSTAAGLIAVKTFERMRIFASHTATDKPRESVQPAEEVTTPNLPVREPLSPARKLILGSLLLFFLSVLVMMSFPQTFFYPATGEAADSSFVRVINSLSILAIPFLLVFFPVFAALKGLKVYEEFVEGGKEGFQVAIRIIPYLVAMLLAITMFRNAGGIEILTQFFRPVLAWLGFPSELLPMAMMRPLSGSATLAIFGDLVKQLGPDHLVTRMGATLYGSTETTFYVIALYFGSVAIHRTRHAIPAGLCADIAGALAAVYICRLVFL